MESLIFNVRVYVHHEGGALYGLYALKDILNVKRFSRLKIVRASTLRRMPWPYSVDVIVTKKGTVIVKPKFHQL